MSTIKADTVTTKTDDTDLTITGHGSGVPNLEAGFKVGGTAGVPVASLRAGTDGELITWDASGNAATVAVGTSTHVLTSNGAGAAPTFQAASAAAGSVYLSAYISGGSQSIARAAWTDVTTWSEYLDSATAFNTTTGVFTFPSAGKYLMIADVAANFDGCGDDGEQMYIRFVDGNANNYAQQRWIMRGATPNIRHGSIGTSIAGSFASSATIKIQMMHVDGDGSGGNSLIDYANFVIMKVAD